FPGSQMSQVQRAVRPVGEEPAQVESPMVPYDIEEQAPVHEFEAQPMTSATPEEITESQAEPQELAAEPSTEPVDEQPVRKRRASSGLTRKTVAPRNTRSATTKRPKKNTSPPPTDGTPQQRRAAHR